MSRKHRAYREIRQEFSPERQQKISAGAAKINTGLKILSTVRQAAGITQEELAELLDVGQSHISQMESRDNITLATLISAITAMGASIDLTIKFPEKPSLHFSQIETLFPEKPVVDRSTQEAPLAQ
jgi:transcriptional regulator with XRE-family HTH domain